MRHFVFISYSNTDKAVADTLCGVLEAAGVPCWIAPRDVQPGREWRPSIIDAIQQTRVMILVFSDESNRSQQVSREVEVAFEEGKTIIPFRIADTEMNKSLRYCISATHWLDALTPPLSEHAARLVSTVTRMLAEARQVSAAAGLPDEWAEAIPSDAHAESAPADSVDAGPAEMPVLPRVPASPAAEGAGAAALSAGEIDAAAHAEHASVSAPTVEALAVAEERMGEGGTATHIRSFPRGRKMRVAGAVAGGAALMTVAAAVWPLGARTRTEAAATVANTSASPASPAEDRDLAGSHSARKVANEPSGDAAVPAARAGSGAATATPQRGETVSLPEPPPPVQPPVEPPVQPPARPPLLPPQHGQRLSAEANSRAPVSIGEVLGRSAASPHEGTMAALPQRERLAPTVAQRVSAAAAGVAMRSAAVAPSVAARAPPAPGAAEAMPARDAAEDARAIQRTVRDFAQLLESRDAGRIANAYPAAGEWVSQWSDFFRMVRRLRVSVIDAGSPAVDGDAAHVDFAARLEWDDDAGTGQHRPQRFSAGFRRQGGRWVLTRLDGR
ncbi:MAG TPA: toll/interleukin-1 receptor domain-containing protein [Longimicrobiaceae bacterium]|jgi:ketosteroid isomerase-like protein|nr:toll/interleukin-1 receptor domain-containing protein [Longimicrobiaceae bacterium]